MGKQRISKETLLLSIKTGTLKVNATRGTDNIENQLSWHSKYIRHIEKN